MKILLADDHDLIRETLAMFLTSQGLGPVVQAGSAHEAERLLRRSIDDPFDIVLLDYDMPGMDGLAGLGRVIEMVDRCPVAILSGIAPPAVAHAAIQAGARGFLPKTMTPQALATAIRQITQGKIILPQGNPEQHANSLFPPLTSREAEVLAGLYSGKSNKEMARELDLQEVTIKLHVRTLCRKLGASNRTQAAMIARDLHKPS